MTIVETQSTLIALLSKLNGNPPADQAAVQQVEKAANIELPVGYKHFLGVMNGGEGIIGVDRYVILWRAEELLSLNEAYEVSDYAPALFLFGSSGGGEAYGFDFRSNKRPIISVPFIGMELEAACMICPDFISFLSGTFRLKSALTRQWRS